jgi:hypothetical protein
LKHPQQSAGKPSPARAFFSTLMKSHKVERWKQPSPSHVAESLWQASDELLLAMQRWSHASPKPQKDRSHSNSRLKLVHSRRVCSQLFEAKKSHILLRLS